MGFLGDILPNKKQIPCWLETWKFLYSDSVHEFVLYFESMVSYNYVSTKITVKSTSVFLAQAAIPNLYYADLLLVQM